MGFNIYRGEDEVVVGSVGVLLCLGDRNIGEAGR